MCQAVKTPWWAYPLCLVCNGPCQESVKGAPGLGSLEKAIDNLSIPYLSSDPDHQRNSSGVTLILHWNVAAFPLSAPQTGLLCALNQITTLRPSYLADSGWYERSIKKEVSAKNYRSHELLLYLGQV